MSTPQISDDILVKTYNLKIKKWFSENNVSAIKDRLITILECSDEELEKNLQNQFHHETIFLKQLQFAKLAGNFSDETRIRNTYMYSIIGIIHYGLKYINDENSFNGLTNLKLDVNTCKYNYIDGYIPCFESNDDDTPYQQCLDFLYSEFWSKNYKKKDGVIYEPILTKTGFNTHAYKKKDTIERIICELTAYSKHKAIWKLKTKCGDLTTALINHMQMTMDPLFPELTTDSNVYSFANGIYIKSKFDEKSKKYSPVFLEYNVDYIPETLVSCKFFDIVFDITNTETPQFDKILDYQQWDEDVKKVFRVLHGRLMYQLGQLDEYWQVAPYIMGQAGTGKSTISQLTKEFYISSDRGIISNNHQKTFGLENLYDKKIIIGPEIKENWNIDQAEFTSIISGDDMTINKKHKKSGEDVEWKVPMILFGNNFPDFVDGSDAISRRIILFEFEYPINPKDSDPLLLESIKKQELAAIIHKHNLEYLNWVNKYKKHNIWDVVPQYFKDKRKTIAFATNGYMHFFENSSLEFGETYYYIYSRFQQDLQEYLKRMGFSIKKCTEETLKTVFFKYRLKPDHLQGHKILRGVRPKQEVDSEYGMI